MTAGVWTATKAQARFSELINNAICDGPQTITRNGRTAVVVVSAEEWERKANRVGNLAEFFAASPLRGLKLKTWRRTAIKLAPRIRGDGGFRKRQSR